MNARVVAPVIAGIVGALQFYRHRATVRALTGAHPAITTDDGVRLHVEVDAPETPTCSIVFAHGFAADAGVYDLQWAALRGQARLVRFDQRGHGRSGWAGSRSATPGRLGRDLEHVIEQLTGPEPILVVGHSMGGMGVLALARRRPDLFGSRVAGVALMSTSADPLAAIGRRPGPVAGARRYLAVAGACLLWLAAPLLIGHPARTRPAHRLLRHQLFAGDPAAGPLRYTLGGWEQTPTPVLSGYLPGLAAYDQRPAMASLTSIPVLVLAGAEDRTIDPVAARRLADGIGPSAHLVLVPGAGHMVPLTHPGAVNTALQAVLDRATATAKAAVVPQFVPPVMPEEPAHPKTTTRRRLS